MKNIVTKLSFFTALFLMSTVSMNAETIYEDAEDGQITGWYIYDKWPSGASVSNIYDPVRKSRVIELKGTQTKNGIRLTGWNNSSEKIIQWKMKSDSWLAMYVIVETTKGFRYLSYSPRNYDKGRNLNQQAYKIRLGLGAEIMSNKWVTITRDLEADLQKYERDNTILSVSGFKVRGSALFDDIKLLNSRNRIVLKDLKAFPTAEGAGAETTGGRGGRVVYVTNRRARGTGSLRDALGQEGNRTIVFAIGGRFNIDAGITLGHKSNNEANDYPHDKRYGNFTVAGQTANNIGGVHLAHSDERDSLAIASGGGATHFNVYNQNNMIFRYFDTRYNWQWWLKEVNRSNEPTFRFSRVNQLIIDHISSGWSAYGLIISNPNFREGEHRLGEITIQRSLMHENTVREDGGNHNVGMLLGKDPRFQDRNTGLYLDTMTKAQWDDMGEFTIHKNAFIGVSHRFPNTSGGENGKFRMVNNYIYGFQGDATAQRLGRIAGTAQNNFIGNVYQQAQYSPNFSRENLFGYLTTENPESIVSKVNFYVKDNLFLNKDGSVNAMTADVEQNKYPMIFDYTEGAVTLENFTAETANLQTAPITPNRYPVSIFNSQDVKEKILANVGGNIRFKEDGIAYVEDIIDKMYLDWAKNNTGPDGLNERMGDASRFIYPSEADHPNDNHNYRAGTQEDVNASILDPDLDGMPTAWEEDHGLNPLEPNNNYTGTLNWNFGNYIVINEAGYSDLEIYLADMAGDFHMLANE